MNRKENIDENTLIEIQRIEDLIEDDIKLLEGACTGFVPSTINSKNNKVNSLVNIRRMEKPIHYFESYREKVFEFAPFSLNEEHGLDSYLSALDWTDKPIFESDIDANIEATMLGMIDGYYDFSDWENVFYGIGFRDKEIEPALDEMKADGVIAKTDHNDAILHSLGLWDTDLDKFVAKDFYIRGKDVVVVGHAVGEIDNSDGLPAEGESNVFLYQSKYDYVRGNYLDDHLKNKHLYNNIKQSLIGIYYDGEYIRDVDEDLFRRLEIRKEAYICTYEGENETVDKTSIVIPAAVVADYPDISEVKSDIYLKCSEGDWNNIRFSSEEDAEIYLSSNKGRLCLYRDRGFEHDIHLINFEFTESKQLYEGVKVPNNQEI